jgi:hypothetical protein
VVESDAMSEARQTDGTLEATGALAGRGIVAESKHFVDTWRSTSMRLLAEGLALEKAAFDVGQPVSSRLICIQAALRTWRELHSLQSEVMRLAMLFAAGHSPNSDATAADIKAIQAAGEFGLESIPRSQEEIRHWIVVGEKLESALQNVANAGNAAEKSRYETILAEYSAATMTVTLPDLETTLRAAAHHLSLPLATVRAQLGIKDTPRETMQRVHGQRIEWPRDRWESAPEKLSRKQHAIEAFMRRVWKPFIEESGAVVTLAMLRNVDHRAAGAWANYVSRSGPVADIPIISTNDLSRPDRPAVFTRTAKSSLHG